MLVYRFEHPDDGHGPYTSKHANDTLWDMKLEHSQWYYEHPSPKIDLKHDIQPEECCGMNSLKSLERWFAGYLVALKDSGFELLTYEVQDSFVKVSEKTGQVVFNRESATVVKTTTNFLSLNGSALAL